MAHRGALVPLLTLLVLSLLAFPAYAAKLDVVVHGSKADADGQGVANDLVVYGKVSITGSDAPKSAKASLYIEVTGPAGSTASAAFEVTGEAVQDGAIQIRFQWAFHNFIVQKGMYTVTVTATWNGQAATASHSFDPSGSSIGPPGKYDAL